MGPVAACLDTIQGEANAYMGILVPNLHIMKTLLERQMESPLEYAMPLAEALLSAYQRRFGHLYSQNNILMATALHPHYTPVVIGVVAPENLALIKNKIIRNCHINSHIFSTFFQSREIQ